MNAILHHFKANFRPSLALTLAALVLAMLTLSLSRWQFERAEHKRDMEEQARQGLAADAVALPRDNDALAPFLRVRARGLYLPDRELLLDNRVHERLAGFHVVTPLLLDDGRVLMVNRGWIGHGGRREADIPPPAAGPTTVSGALYFDNRAAFRLSAQPEQGKIHQQLNLQALQKDFDETLLPFVLFQDAPGDGLAAAAVPADFKSQRSTVYAWQWLSLAILVVVFYFILGCRREK